MTYTHAHQLLRDICHVAATKMALPTTTPRDRTVIRDMAAAAAETVYTAINFEQFMSISWDDHRTATERRQQFVDATMADAERQVSIFVRNLTHGGN